MSAVLVITHSGVTITAQPHIMLLRLKSLLATLQQVGDFENWPARQGSFNILMQFEEVVAQAQVMLRTRWDKQLGQPDSDLATNMVMWLLRVPSELFRRNMTPPEDPWLAQMYTALSRVDWEQLRVDVHVMKYGTRPTV